MSKRATIAFGVVALLSVAAFIAVTIFRPAPIATPVAPQAEISIEYTLEEGGDTSSGPADSPLEAQVRLPWRAGDPDTVFSSVSIQFIDEKGNPAIFGGKPFAPVEMRAGIDVADWFYSGSLPTNPGIYNARLTLQRLYGGAQPETVDLPSPTITSLPDTGTPLTSGFVFDSGPDLWLLSSDAARHRRITFFSPLEESATAPAWSPDGAEIAFVYSRQVAKDQPFATEIRLIGSDGTGGKTLVPAQVDRTLAHPSWSADGKYIYYTVEKTDLERSETTRHIAQVTVATGESGLVVPSASMPHAGAPGDTIVYLEGRTDPDTGSLMQSLVRANARGEDKKVLVGESAFSGIASPRISPDGKWVAFSAVNRDEPGGGPDLLRWLLFQPQTAHAHGLPWDIYAVPIGGGAPVRLTTLVDDEPRSTWIDDSTLAFMGMKGLHVVKIGPDGKPQGELQKLHAGADHGGLSFHGP